MVNVQVNLKGPKKKLSTGNIKAGRYAVANQVLADSNNYVPALDHHLRPSGIAQPDGKAVTWNTPYAKAQFYGKVGKGGYPVKNYTTPGTGPRWDKKAKGIHMKDWERAFVKGAEW